MRHPNQRAIPTIPRASVTFEHQAYIFEKRIDGEWKKLSGHGSPDACIKSALGFSGERRVLRAADKVVVWSSEEKRA